MSIQKGWDGTLNGYPLSTSDYWFVINRPSNNTQYHGHFTLKH
ncbi:T9SS type B sorting domain-containing protein [Algibacter sp. L1A34]